MRKPFMNSILARLAPQLGANLLIEPEFGFVGLIVFPNGRQSFFWDNKFNLNPLSSVKIARDKAYASFFLRSLGYSVPKEKTFFRARFRQHLEKSRGLEEAYRYAQELGWPVFLKPCRLSQGQFIAKVYSREEFYRFAPTIFKHDRVMIVQQACMGSDYRVIVLDQEVLCAYRRKPLSVVGDGFSTVEELLAALQERFIREGRDTVVPMADERIQALLRRSGYDYKSTIPKGHLLQLLDVANLSLGGTLEDVTDQLHPDYANLCIRVARQMDLRFCGVDILTNDATAPLADYAIIEINSAPGLDNYLFTGEQQQDYVDSLYLKVLRAIMNGSP